MTPLSFILNLGALTLQGIFANLWIMILGYVGFKILAKEIRVGIKQFPVFITQYFKLQREQMIIAKARNGLR